MNLLEVTYLSVFGVGLFLGLFHLLVWFRLREQKEFLFASFMGFAAGILGLCEASYLQGSNPAAHQAGLEVQNVGIGVVLVSMVWFVRARLGTGRLWLALAISVSWLICVIASIASPGNLTFVELTSVNEMTTGWGETYHIAQGVAHPLRVLSDLTTLAIIGFVIDATIVAWRRGRKRDAFWVGGPILFFIVVAGVHTPLVDTGVVQTPYMISVIFGSIVVALTVSLVEEVVSASKLTRQLAVEKHRWDAFLENVELAVVRTDAAGRMSYVNPFLQRISGRTQAELVGREPTDLIAEEERSAMREVIADGANWTSRSNRLRKLETASGELRDVLWFSVAMTDDNGRQDGFISFGQDLTDQRAAQADLDLAREELERLSRALTMGEMASAFAHELSQPIAAILSNAQALEMMSDDNEADRAERREILGDIISDTRRARDLMDRVRAFIFNAEPERRRFELDDMIAESVEMLRHEARKSSVRLETRPPGKPISVVGARTELQQVVTNLILNALQAIGDIEDGRVLVEWGSTESGQIEIRVDDNGPGLSEEISETLMNPFVTTKNSGSGIGLAVSSRIAKRHGGEIGHGDSPLGGARFVLSLPSVTADTHKGSPEAQIAVPAG